MAAMGWDKGAAPAGATAFGAARARTPQEEALSDRTPRSRATALPPGRRMSGKPEGIARSRRVAPEELAFRRAMRRPDVARVVRLVADTAGVDDRLFFARSRGCVRIAAARQMAMYLLNVALGFNFTDIGAIFRRDRTTVRYACARIEDRRDDPADPEFEAAIRRLEAALSEVAEEPGEPHRAAR